MRRTVLAVFGTVAGLVGLLSFKTHAVMTAAVPAAVSTSGPDAGAGTGGSGTGGSGAGGSGAGGSGASGSATGSKAAGSPASASSSAASPTSAAPTTKTVTGDSVDTRWGPVQVRITVTRGKLTGATAVDYPDGNPRDQQINAYALPALTKEALAAGSAKIDVISGATYTSDGYIGSLQSALDKAGL